MTTYNEAIMETATADGALTKGYGVVMSGNEGAATADLVDAADECDGVCAKTVADGDYVPVVTHGPAIVYMGDTTAARNYIKCHTDGTWLAADANNAQGWLLTGGATGEQKALFFGKQKLLAPSTS